jgi:hypothetical protein
MSQIDEVRTQGRENLNAERNATITGALGAALVAGAVGPDGMNKLPNTIGPLPTEAAIGAGLLFVYRKKSGKRAAMMRGAGLALVLADVKDLGASLAKQWA